MVSSYRSHTPKTSVKSFVTISLISLSPSTGGSIPANELTRRKFYSMPCAGRQDRVTTDVYSTSMHGGWKNLHSIQFLASKLFRDEIRFFHEFHPFVGSNDDKSSANVATHNQIRFSHTSCHAGWLLCQR